MTIKSLTKGYGTIHEFVHDLKLDQDGCLADYNVTYQSLDTSTVSLRSILSTNKYMCVRIKHML